jgi:hypothetical protein
LQPVLDADARCQTISRGRKGGRTQPVALRGTNLVKTDGPGHHFRRFRPSGKAGDGKESSFYVDENRVKPSTRETIYLAIIHAAPEEVRRALGEHGVAICGEILTADMRGERGEDGRWPRVLEGFISEHRP